MSMTTDEQRGQQRAMWSAAAAAWERWDDWLEHSTAPLTTWLIDAAGVRAGGRVRSTPVGVDCTSNSTGPGCEDLAFAADTSIELVATPDPGGNTFSGWSGDACDGSSASVCRFTLDRPMTITARFD
jgi:Divergent InlB B-repeat domain